jgi:hypothetical protein
MEHGKAISVKLRIVHIRMKIFFRKVLEEVSLEGDGELRKMWLGFGPVGNGRVGWVEFVEFDLFQED